MRHNFQGYLAGLGARWLQGREAAEG
jgi:hypothetical protein